ncbi:DUF3263 domain-containing protein [Rhodococcus wratislaviensis]|uniref:DUF3263 domain-containing protein n=1 Tax=Rhodococcus wratislaviensis TaxID=44752 RepID=UPI003519CE78
MTNDHRAMLEFARIWAPYGGAHPGDIFVGFGMSPAKFYHIIRRLLQTVHVRWQVPADERSLLEEIASRNIIDHHPNRRL